MKNIIDNLSAIRAHIDSLPARSAWRRGVKVYAAELLDNLESIPAGESPATIAQLNAAMLNGARDWYAYSWGGSSLIYDDDIAETLCTPSELRRYRQHHGRPNAREEWLDVQARALGQAAAMVKAAARVILAD
jgi:hypothetical protein